MRARGFVGEGWDAACGGAVRCLESAGKAWICCDERWKVVVMCAGALVVCSLQTLQSREDVGHLALLGSLREHVVRICLLCVCFFWVWYRGRCYICYCSICTSYFCTCCTHADEMRKQGVLVKFERDGHNQCTLEYASSYASVYRREVPVC